MFFSFIADVYVLSGSHDCSVVLRKINPLTLANQDEYQLTYSHANPVSCMNIVSSATGSSEKFLLTSSSFGVNLWRISVEYEPPASWKQMIPISMAVSPDNLWFVLCSFGNCLKVWDLHLMTKNFRKFQKNQCSDSVIKPTQFKVPPDFVFKCVSTDGRQICASNDKQNQICVWDAITGENPMLHIKLAFSNWSQPSATSIESIPLQLFVQSQGSCQAPQAGLMHQPKSIVFNFDGTRVACLTEHSLSVFETCLPGRQLFSSSLPSVETLPMLFFNSDGSKVACLSSGHLVAFDSGSGKKLISTFLHTLLESKQVSSAAFNADGSIFFFGLDKMIFVWKNLSALGASSSVPEESAADSGCVILKGHTLKVVDLVCVQDSRLGSLIVADDNPWQY